MATSSNHNIIVTEEVFCQVLQELQINLNLKAQQKECIQYLVNRDDVFAVLPTGYGKTLIIYSLLPIIFSKLYNTPTSCVLVISPLISLMKDQVQQLHTFGINSAYLGEKLEDDIHKNVKEGKVPILLMSPEGLFSGSWRELFSSCVYQRNLCSIVIDEAHCVEQWGDQFRTDYSRLDELRSIFPKSPVLALTATATPDSRRKIAIALGMTIYKSVIVSCNRSNIFYFCEKGHDSVEISLAWLVSKLQSERNKTPKAIIYCRNIKTCSIIYSMFLRKLGLNNSYCGKPSAKNCLFAMFHHATAEKNKNIVTTNFKSQDSKTRIVIATTAFGMGINVPDVRYVVHWGASRSLQGFMQESGRAGRDGLPSYSVLYYHGVNISNTATDNGMQSYCKLDSCRRDFLINHFTPENVISKQDKHMCCDKCISQCSCGDSFHSFEFSNDSIDTALMTNCSFMEIERTVRNVSIEQRTEIQELISKFRVDTISMCESNTLMNGDILSGFNDSMIRNVVDNCHYIFDWNDCYPDFIFDVKLAKDVVQIINSVLE